MFGGLTIEEAVMAYFEKHDALRRRDLTKLRAIRQSHPAIFDHKVDAEVASFIHYIHAIEKSPDFQARYKALQKKKMRDKLTLVQS